MARLPSERYLMQEIGGQVILFEDGSEREILRCSPGDPADVDRAAEVLAASELGPEDMCFASFWLGYFCWHAGFEHQPDPLGRYAAGTDARGNVYVLDAGGREIVTYAQADAGATARAQKIVHDSALGAEVRALVHFWCGFFWAGSGCGGF
jgi:hypothetical protein